MQQIHVVQSDESDNPYLDPKRTNTFKVGNPLVGKRKS